MRPVLTVLVALAFAMMSAWSSSAVAATATKVRVTIDLSQQTMRLTAPGVAHVWPVSTARRPYRTPTGTFRPVRLERMWHSRKYDWAPMPYSVFFYHGYAIHGTTHTRDLGRPASHGCVRLRTSHARMLYSLVRRYGRTATRIVVRP